MAYSGTPQDFAYIRVSVRHVIGKTIIFGFGKVGGLRVLSEDAGKIQKPLIDD